MTSLLTLTVDIRPIAKQSTRFGGGRAYTSRRHLVYAKAIATALAIQLEEQQWVLDDTSPLSVHIQAHFRWPKNVKESIRKSIAPRISVPDCDNIAKPVLDACGAIWGDDRQVADLRVRKFNSPSNKLVITVQRWYFPLEPIE